MSTITRKEFVKELSQGTINVNDMAPENKEKLNQAGITDKQLAKIAGKDGQIHGQKEFKKLFKAVDKFDKNHSNSSFATERKDGTPTKSGTIHEALKSEVDHNRAEASRQGVIHLGMREESSKEAEALERGNKKAQGGVHRVEGFKSEGEISYNGKKLDLKTREGLTQFQEALASGPDKMPKDQVKKFVDFLATQKNESRDELAQLGLKFHQTGEGRLPVNRLVISGHGFDGEISGEGEGSFKLTDVEALGKVFPKGAAKIEHVAVSACFCASNEHFDTLRSTFPNLKSAFAYNAYSPKAEKEAPKHLKKWESLTDGNDSSQVDPMFKKTATWNVKDGVQGLPKTSVLDAMKNSERLRSAFDAYMFEGKPLKEATHDEKLNQFYESLAAVIQHPDVPADEKAKYEATRKMVFRLRHPELSH